MIRPLSGQILLRILPPKEQSDGGIEIPQHTVTPQEQEQLNHHPEPPPPLEATVLAIGPWKRLGNGMMVPPPFPPGSKVLIRSTSGKDLSYGTNDKLKMVMLDDILAVLQESC